MKAIAKGMLRTFNYRSSAIAVLLSLGAVMATHVYAATQPSKSTQQKAAAPEAASAPLPNGVVARVNGVPITQDQVDQAVRASNAPDTPALRTNIKNQLIARELFRQAAEKEHYDARPEVQAAINQMKSGVIVQAYLRDQIKPTPVTDADVKAQYDKIIGTLGDNEYKPSAIAVKDADTAQKVLDQLKKGADFAQLAKQYSQGPGAAQGGALNWISFKTPIVAGNTQNWPQPLAEALVKLPQGGVSDTPIQVGDAFWILRVDQKRPTQVPQFDQIKDVLRKQLEQVAIEKATTQVVAGLVKDAHIQQ
jgi:peptidyl-prolyl cis-trans isomerase C